MKKIGGEMMEYIQIAIDGPAGAGKSTIARHIAEQLHYTYIDTGSMYRAITLKAMNLGIDLHDESQFNFVKSTNLSYHNGVLWMDGEDVSFKLREHNISNNVSLVSSYLSVRNECVAIQRDIAKLQNVVMDGRDIGYNVLPNAQFKFFLTASIEQRAKRRYKDNLERGIKSNLDILKERIAERDFLDSTRQHSPLRPAEDAIIIDTSTLSIEQVVALITNKIKEVMNNGI